MGIGAAIGGIASGLLGASASNKAASASERASERTVALQEKIYEQTTKNFSPYLDAGNTALQAYMYEMGLGPAPSIGGAAPSIETITTPGASSGPRYTNPMLAAATGNADTRNSLLAGQSSGTPGTTQYRVNGQTFSTLADAQAYAASNPTGGSGYQGFTATPAYQFQLQQGQDSINALAGAKGGLNSGATLKALSDYNQGLASQEYSNYLNRLSGLTNMGTSAAANQASAGQSYASNTGNALMTGAQATANGYINSANAINGGINNALGAWQYQRSLGQ